MTLKQGIIAGTLVIAIGAAAYATNKLFFNPYARVARELPAAMAKAQSLGLPMTASDLTRKQPVDPKENMAPLILEASKRIKADRKLGRALTELWGSYFANPSPEALKAQIATLGNFPTLCEEIGKRRHSDFQTDWDTEPWSRPRYVTDIVKIDLVLCARSRIAIKSGQFDEAMRFAQLASNVGDAILETRSNLDLMMSTLCEAVDASSWTAAIESAQNDLPKLNKIRSALNNLPPTPDLRPFLEADFYRELAIARHAPEFSSRPESRAKYLTFPRPYSIKRSGLPEGTINRAILAKSVQYWNSLIESYNKRDPLAAKIVFLSVYKKQVENQDDPDHLLSIGIGNTRLPVSLLNQLMTRQANRSMIKGLAHAFIFRAKHQRFPNSFEEARFDEMNPFNMLPFELSIKGDQCIVSNPGTNIFAPEEPKGKVNKEIQNVSSVSCRIK